MAEYENPEFDKDDYDEEAETSFTDEEQFQRRLNSQFAGLKDLTGDDRTTLRNSIGQKMKDRFYERNEEPTRKVKGLSLKKDDFGRPMLYIKDGAGKDITLTYYRSNAPDEIATYLSFNTLQRKYGVDFVRNILDVDDFQPSATRLKEGRETFQALITTRNQITRTEGIELRGISTTTDVQNTLKVATEMETNLDTALKEITTDATDEVGTQTEGLNLRELQGLDKALQRIRGELVNNLAKLTDIDKDIAKEKKKLQQATDDEFQIQLITERLKNLEDERSVRLEAASDNKEALRSQVNRIKETINKVLKEDTTLGERLRTLFKEQGITIVSVLTAIGMIIGVIVEAVIPTSVDSTTPPPKDGSGVKDWIKKQLSNLGKLLANLAGKAAAALPGVIGSIVSWLLTTTGKVVNWFGKHLWAVVVLVVGLLYAAAREYINKSHR